MSNCLGLNLSISQKNRKIFIIKKVVDMEKATVYNGEKIYEILLNIIENKPIKNFEIFDSSSLINNPFNTVNIVSHFFVWIDDNCRLESTFFLFFYIFYGACERKNLIKNSYADIIYEICHRIFNLLAEDFKKGRITSSTSSPSRFITSSIKPSFSSIMPEVI